MDIQIIAQEGCYPDTDYGNAGWDLFANESRDIPPQSGELISLGIRTAFDPEYVALLWDRSGLSSKHDIHRFAGVIDSNYRGDWKVKLFNHSSRYYRVEKGDKIIQVLFQRIEDDIYWEVVDELPESIRDEKGFGSSDLTKHHTEWGWEEWTSFATGDVCCTQQGK